LSPRLTFPDESPSNSGLEGSIDGQPAADEAAGSINCCRAAGPAYTSIGAGASPKVITFDATATGLLAGGDYFSDRLRVLRAARGLHAEAGGEVIAELIA
jgi:hypothetical protein